MYEHNKKNCVMKEKDIVTTDKETFLKAEYPCFKNIWKSYNKFKKEMSDDIKKCEKCGVLYWNNCQKRCQHK